MDPGNRETFPVLPAAAISARPLSRTCPVPASYLEMHSTNVILTVTYEVIGMLNLSRFYFILEGHGHPCAGIHSIWDRNVVCRVSESILGSRFLLLKPFSTGC
jgi:hypothetical protein